MMKKILLPLWIIATANSLVAAPSETGETKKKDAMSRTKKVVIGAVGIAGTAAVGYFVYRFATGNKNTIPRSTEKKSTKGGFRVLKNKDLNKLKRRKIQKQQNEDNSKKIQPMLASKSTLESEGTTSNNNNTGVNVVEYDNESISSDDENH